MGSGDAPLLQPHAGASVVLQLDTGFFQRLFKGAKGGGMARQPVVALRFKIAQRVHGDVRRFGELRLYITVQR